MVLGLNAASNLIQILKGKVKISVDGHLTLDQFNRLQMRS